MADTEEQSEAESPEEAQPAKKSSGMFFVVIGIVVLVLAGGGGFFFLKRAKAAPPRTEEGGGEKAPPAPSEIKTVLHLETFTVNMDDPEQKTYLRIGIDLGLASASKGESKAPSPTALVRDTILNVLMVAKPADVATAEGKNQLKQRLLEALQQRAPELDVREIYFTEFLLQR